MRGTRTRNHRHAFDRTLIFTLGFLLLFAVMGAYLFDLQVVKYQTLLARAQRVYSGYGTILPKRGDIVVQGRNGETYKAATSDSFFNVYWNAKTGKAADLDALAAIVPLVKSKDAILQGADAGQTYALVAKGAPLSAVKQILAAKLGVDTEEYTVREYPFDALASQSVGFTLTNNQREEGQYGLEAYYDGTLSGTGGYTSNDAVLKNAQDGATLVTSIDINIQREAEQVLRQGVEKYKAESGLAVVMDAKTGEILAAAQEPGFDLNRYSKVSDYSVFKNLMIEPYEPGSVFKVITYSAALNERVIQPTDTYNDAGKVYADGYTIRNYDNKAHGVITFQQALDHSYNLGAIQVLDRLGYDAFFRYVQAFGFGKTAGIDLPFEKTGSYINLTKSYRRTVNYYTASFGQGVSVTPVQLLAAFSAFANGGVMIQPHFVREIRFADGRVTTIAPKVLGQPISAATAAEMTTMLEHVVEAGSGRYAKIPGFRVSGKTGSAQVPIKGGYSPDEVINTFVGFLPAGDPRVIILVKLDKPTFPRPPYSEVTAVPTWNALASFVAQYLYLQPDNLQ